MRKLRSDAIDTVIGIDPSASMIGAPDDIIAMHPGMSHLHGMWFASFCIAAMQSGVDDISLAAMSAVPTCAANACAGSCTAKPSTTQNNKRRRDARFTDDIL